MADEETIAAILTTSIAGRMKTDIPAEQVPDAIVSVYRNVLFALRNSGQWTDQKFADATRDFIDSRR